MMNVRDLKCLTRLLSLLVLALLLAQSIGMMHRVVHANIGEPICSIKRTEAAHPLHALWGEHSHASDCRVFDQHSPDLLNHVVLQLILPMAMPMHGQLVLSARALLFERFYAAQAPPVSLP